MRLSAKPISSPSRTDHFPPPLMRFLRTDAGSRSRSGRSRSSPIFVRKKNGPIETQEPSSPKVTCMGQVRARRSSKSPAARPVRCRWIRTALSLEPRHCRTFWNKCVSFFQRRRESRRKSSNSESRVGNETEVWEQDEENGRDEGEAATDTAFASSVSSPPKNALILTRCRSAPHRSSSSAYRFWSSPMRSEGTGEEHQTERGNGNNPTSQTESENLGLFKKPEPSITEANPNSVNCKESKAGQEEKESRGSSRPLILTRCKSEPARVADKLFPEFNFREEGRLGMAANDSLLPYNVRFID